MSALAWPDHLVTLAEWDALPEDTSHRYELVEGTLQVSPRPGVAHQWAVSELHYQLREQLPDWLRPLPEVEVVLFENHPPTVRIPDLVAVRREVARSGVARCAARDVLLACEIVSPGSVRTDRITKLAEYADAKVPGYWIVDVTTSRPSVEVYRLNSSCYEQVTVADSQLSESRPAPVTIDVGALH